MEAILTSTTKTKPPSSTKPIGRTGEVSSADISATTRGVAASSARLDGQRRSTGCPAGGTQPALILDRSGAFARSIPATSGGTPGSTTTPTLCPGTLAPPTLVMPGYYVTFRQSGSLAEDSQGNRR